MQDDILLQEDFLLKPFFLFFLSREKKEKKYMYQVLQYEDVLSWSGGEVFSPYTQALKHIIQNEKDSQRRLFFLLVLASGVDKEPLLHEIVEQILAIREPILRQKIIHLL